MSLEEFISYQYHLYQLQELRTSSLTHTPRWFSDCSISSVARNLWSILQDLTVHSQKNLVWMLLQVFEMSESSESIQNTSVFSMTQWKVIPYYRNYFLTSEALTARPPRAYPHLTSLARCEVLFWNFPVYLSYSSKWRLKRKWLDLRHFVKYTMKKSITRKIS